MSFFFLRKIFTKSRRRVGGGPLDGAMLDMVGEKVKIDVGDDDVVDNEDGDDDDTSKTFILGPQQNEKCMVSTGITFGVNTDVVADPILISAGDSLGG